MSRQKAKSRDEKSHEPTLKNESTMLTAPELSDELARVLAEHTKHDHPRKESTEGVLTKEVPTKEELADELANAENDAAVDDILRNEGDEALARQDASIKQAPKKRGFWRSIGHFFVAWWRNKWARWVTILLVLVAVTTGTVFPESRYYALNAVGVRSSVSVIAVDNATRLPLRNVTVAVDGQKTRTGSDGVAKLQNLRLGEHTLTIKRIAFAPIAQKVTVGWGSNPLGKFLMHPTGVHYTLRVYDYVSEKPIVGAEATSGQAVAVSDKNGLITLTLDDEAEATTADVAVTAKQYRTEHLTIRLTENAEQSKVILTPAAKAVFVSKQNGKFDLVSTDVDGKNRAVLLPGTGLENNNITVAVDDTNKYAALVSTRDSVRDSDGYLFSTLSLVNVEKGTTITIDHAEQIKLVDWIGTRLIYEQAIAGTSASNPQRYRLMSYDFTTSNRVQLVTANQFNAVVSAQGAIYYAIGGADPAAQAAFFKVKPDGTGRQTVLNQETWSALRTDFNTLTLQTPGGWYRYALAGTIQKTIPPAAYQNRLYASNSSHNIWVDLQDGLGALIDYNAATGKEKVVRRQGGLNNPLHWLSNSAIVYRVATPQETADYVVDINGGPPKKISDVTNTYGLSQSH